MVEPPTIFRDFHNIEYWKIPYIAQDPERGLLTSELLYQKL